MFDLDVRKINLKWKVFMTEKEKMLHRKMYDANYDEELKMDRTKCKLLCQKYNNLPVDDFAARESLIKEIIGKTGDSILIEPDFWCDYGWNIEVGEILWECIINCVSRKTA